MKLQTVHCRTLLLVSLLILAMTVSTQGDQKLPVAPFVSGYAGQVSVTPGEELGFHLSSSAARVSLTIERLGVDKVKVWEQADIATVARAIPDKASSDGCAWPEDLRIKIPADWTSGYYQGTLRTQNEDKEVKSNLFFIVRSAQPGTRTKILMQLATNTYNAYTNWGGHSLYAYHDRDGLQGHQVSFDRPLTSQFENWEGPFVRWAESQGYVIDYAANSDLEFHPELLEHYRLVLSVGHDEYWSSLMRDHLEDFIARGGNVAFFSGNTCCWQVRSQSAGRTLVCWKQNLTQDPLFRTADERLLSTLWSHDRVGRPENQLTGVGFLWGGYHRSHGEFMDGPASYEIHRPEHWVLAGTGLKKQDRFGGKDTIVGYECDGCEMRWQDGLPYPTGSDGTPLNFTIIGTCPARWAAGDSHWYDRFPKDRIGAAVMGVYTHPAQLANQPQGERCRGTVFTCGSTDWAHGLKGNDPVVAQITKNILDRMSVQ